MTKARATDGLNVDLLITLAFCIFWLLFSWQHGFYNSPDSWYRGVLGKSIAEGHPYYINLKQGWLYDFGPWHHDATHSPFLPALYAMFFLIFGCRISIANIIVSLSAGLLIFPLLRLSRRMFGTPFVGLVVYLLTAFNAKSDFLFEVFAGLSIPTTVMLLAFFFFFLWRMLEAENKSFICGGVASLVAFFYIRPGEQVVFAWLLFWTLIAGKILLEQEGFKRLKQMWLWAALLAGPWIIRNLILFKHPFFTHTTAALWTDRGYDYWTYHEHMSFPTMASYFKNHTFFDFINKLFVQGTGNYLSIFSQTLYGPLWVSLAVFVVALFVIFTKERKRSGQFFFSVLSIAFVGYSVVYSIVPVLDKRYMVLPFFLLTLGAVAAVFYLFRGLAGQSRWVFYGLLLLAVFFLQKDFWLGDFVKQFNFSFANSDAALRNDPLIIGLKEKIKKEGIILGPFADVQRLNFATGLTLIEEPDNLRQLTDPAEFFRKYNIRYSLVDVSRLLPKKMIEEMEMVGDRVLFTIGKEGAQPKKKKLFEKFKSLSEPDIRRSIQRGIKNKLVYIDAFHGVEPAEFQLFREMGIKIYLSYASLANNKDKLFQRGLLIMNYGMGKRELSEAEHEVIRQYIANGGRIFLLCPAWVWVAYEKKGLERLPYNVIAKNFDILITTDYVSPPMKIVDSLFKIGEIDKELGGTFSGVIYENATPILVGSDGRAAAVRAQKNKARIIVWGHNNLMSKEFLAKPKNKSFLRRIFNWLLAD